MKLIRIESSAQLQQLAEPWDDLWLRSDATLPTLRAQSLALWLKCFAAGKPFLALAVEDGGSLVAALPLVQSRTKGLACGSLPRNCWTDAGDLLVDPNADSGKALQLLLAGIRRLPWSIIDVAGVNLDRPAWQELLSLLQRRGHRFAVRPKFHVGLVDVCGDWAAYEAAWSGNHRRALRKSLKRLQARGDVELQRFANPGAAEASDLLRRVCELEDLSWKGNAGSSILRTPGMFQFFSQQAEILAHTGNVELLFLVQGEHTLAADYGYLAKGVHHSHKIAHDPQFRDVSPGQLLCHAQLREYFSHPDYRLVDTLGILSEANAKWATRIYTVSQAFIDTGGIVGRSFVWGYQNVWPTVRQWLGRSDDLPGLSKPGAADFLASRAAGEPCEVSV